MISNLILKSGIIFILSAPSGGGKTTLANALLKVFPDLSLSISVTTRPPRKCEQEGKQYFFKTNSEFLKLINQNAFLEYAKVYDNYYGTLKKPIFEKLNKQIDILFDIDWQGAKAIKEKVKNIKVVTIFVLPPSIEILKRRLTIRDQDNREIITQRINLALEEIKHASEYEYIVVNDNFTKCVEELSAIIIVERIKNSTTDKLQEFLSKE